MIHPHSSSARKTVFTAQIPTEPTIRIHAFAIALLLALAPFSDIEARPLDYHDVSGLEYADSPALSPDGDEVVYVRRHLDRQTVGDLGQIWLIDLDSGQQQPLTGRDGSFSSPAWSPDCTQIAFIGSDEDGDRQFHALWLDSGKIQHILAWFERYPGSGTN